jgi:hypothetical protein
MSTPGVLLSIESRTSTSTHKQHTKREKQVAASSQPGIIIINFN